MNPSIYIETTVVSYLVSRPSRDLVTAANQQITRDWWTDRSTEFDLYVSEIVVQESKAGDPKASECRLRYLEGIPELDITAEARTLARELVARVPLPEKAALDALHIAVATVNGMDYLLTWNCAHIANAALRHAIEAICLSLGYEAPVICTPQELLEV